MSEHAHNQLACFVDGAETRRLQSPFQELSFNVAYYGI